MDITGFLNDLRNTKNGSWTLNDEKTRLTKLDKEGREIYFYDMVWRNGPEPFYFNWVIFGIDLGAVASIDLVADTKVLPLNFFNKLTLWSAITNKIHSVEYAMSFKRDILNDLKSPKSDPFIPIRENEDPHIVAQRTNGMRVEQEVSIEDRINQQVKAINKEGDIIRKNAREIRSLMNRMNNIHR